MTNNLRYLLFAAGLLSGLLAGGDVYRYVIEVPAWRHLDIVTWAAYSRYADMGNGIFLFPLEAIGSSICLTISSVKVLKSKPALKSIAWAIHSATIFSIIGLVFTLFAAPLMLHLQSVGNNPEKIQQTFDQFHFWGYLRAIAQLLSFCACAFAMLKSSRFIAELHT